MIERLALAGMDAVRLNFSHGTHAEHGAAIDRVRAVSRRIEKPIAVIADSKAPRSGPTPGGGVP